MIISFLPAWNILGTVLCQLIFRWFLKMVKKFGVTQATSGKTIEVKFWSMFFFARIS